LQTGNVVAHEPRPYRKCRVMRVLARARMGNAKKTV
jgi:hypothetical protein